MDSKQIPIDNNKWISPSVSKRQIVWVKEVNTRRRDGGPWNKQCNSMPNQCHTEEVVFYLNNNKAGTPIQCSLLRVGLEQHRNGKEEKKFCIERKSSNLWKSYKTSESKDVNGARTTCMKDMYWYLLSSIGKLKTSWMCLYSGLSLNRNTKRGQRKVFWSSKK